MRYDFDLSTSGGRIRYVRIRKGISQKRLAELIGISVKQLQRYELNNVAVSGYSLMRLCEVLKVDPSYILIGKKE